ncbi:MAG: hypothetical protein R3D89_01310 [Sphingomonadaceae bacterium]
MKQAFVDTAGFIYEEWIAIGALFALGFYLASGGTPMLSVNVLLDGVALHSF